jgi:hypothetical protein
MKSKVKASTQTWSMMICSWYAALRTGNCMTFPFHPAAEKLAETQQKAKRNLPI